MPQQKLNLITETDDPDDPEFGCPDPGCDWSGTCDDMDIAGAGEDPVDVLFCPCCGHNFDLNDLSI